MSKKKILLISSLGAIALIIVLAMMSMATLPWPEGPLYDFEETAAASDLPADKKAAMEAISGRYAHFDIVSYEDLTTRSPMRTFIVSYGFTDFFVEGGRLFQTDRFVHAEQILNQKNTTSMLDDKSVIAIPERTTEVELRYVDGAWTIYRPATPVLLGIDGDSDRPLSRDPEDPNLRDPDEDGNPGVTVYLDISGFLKGEIYITRREIFENHLTVFSEDLILGHVEDSSEQFVVGASLGFLNRPSNNRQHPEPGMNPLILKRVDKDMDTWEELKKIRDEIFPPSPAFY